MKHFRLVLPLVLILLVAACTPGSSTPSPAAPEIVYSGNAGEVYPVVVRAISTSPGLSDSNGWIITQSDAAGGFVAAETTVRIKNFLGRDTGDTERESISVVVSGNPNNQTAVVTQFTSGAGTLAALVHEQLTAAFGEPLRGGTLTPSN